MIECPVCRSPVLGRPESCNSCGTPLEGTSSGRLPVIISLLFPGVAHFSLGYPLLGSLVVLGSFLLGLYIIFTVLSPALSVPLLVILGLIWGGWAFGWGMHTAYLRRRYTDGDFLIFYLVGLLILLNVTALFFWLLSLIIFI